MKFYEIDDSKREAGVLHEAAMSYEYYVELHDRAPEDDAKWKKQWQ